MNEYVVNLLKSAGIENCYITFETSSLIADNCYEDTVDRLLPFGPTRSQINTPDWCKSFCFPGYAYAGVQYGNECWCGNEKPDDSRRKLSTFCTMSCPGNSRQVMALKKSLEMISTALIIVDLKRVNQLNYRISSNCPNPL